jgi:hypothetical protein
MPYIVTTRVDVHGDGLSVDVVSRRAVATLEKAWLAAESAERESDEVAYFYRRAGLPLGTRVLSADDPGRRGTIVKRGGQQWTTRDRAPYVRWDGRIPAEQVPWERLLLTATELPRSASCWAAASRTGSRSAARTSGSPTGLLVVPTPDSDVNAHSARTVSPRRLAESARASITEHGADRLAAGLFSEHLVASIDEGEDVIAELLAHYDRGVRP